jgi:two-component system, OmpR family, KDP operon response regulator KdpE
MKVLIIDDEPQIRRTLQAALSRDGWEVMLAASGDEGLDLAAAGHPDLVILDLVMAGMSGFEVCRHLRRWTKTPVIVLSVRNSEDDKIQALDLGADDYLTKPFGMREMFARIRAVMRRTTLDETQSDSQFSCEDLLVDFAQRRVMLSGQEIHITPKEYDLLRYMVLNANRVLTHRQLLKDVWGSQYENDAQTLRVHIANLRNKIEPHPERPRFIHTEPRVGYRFRADT